MNLIAKQQCVKSKKFEIRMEAISMKGIKASKITLSTSTLLSSLRYKNIDEKILDELMMNMKELKVEMTTLKKDINSSTL